MRTASIKTILYAGKGAKLAQEPFEKIQPLFAAGLEKFSRKKI